MKKFISVLIVAIMCVASVAVNAEVVFPTENATLANCFTDASHTNTTDYVKYDASENAVKAISPAKQEVEGRLTLPTAIADSKTVFGFTVKLNSENHQKTQLKFYDSSGNNFFVLHVNYANENFYLANGASRYDISFYGTLSAEIRVEMKFDFTNSKCYIRQALKENGRFVWKNWTDNQASFVSDVTAADLKTVGVYAKQFSVSDLSLYDVTVAAPDTEEVYSDTIYKRICNEKFSAKPSNLTEKVTDGNHFIKYDDDSRAWNIHAYSADARGNQEAKVTFDNAVSTDEAKFAFTFNTGTGHNRMKIHFVNSSDEKVHSLYLTYDANKGEKVFLARDFSVKVAEGAALGTPVRAEIKFNFSKKTTSYRMGTLNNGEWVFGSWSTTHEGFNPEGDAEVTAYDIKSIIFGNNWALCNATIDDLEVYVPKLSVSGCSVDANTKKVSVTVKNNDEASNGRILCAVYDANDTLAEVKLNDESTALNSGDNTVEFEFLKATDFTKFKVFMWDSLETMVPVSFVYSN